MNAFAELKSLTHQIFSEQPIEQHPLFLHMEENRFSPDQAKLIALQIYHVVEYFPRFLAAILTSIPDYVLRMPLVENLFEEHGRMNVKLVHLETYKQFLYGIGVTREEITASKPDIPVIAYTRAVTDLCLHHPYEEGLGALGVIEEIVARVSPIVARYALAHYSKEKGSLVHFTDHETLDVAHANEIYEIAAQVFAGQRKELVIRGLQLGYYYQSRLYSDILAAAQDRRL